MAAFTKPSYGAWQLHRLVTFAEVVKLFHFLLHLRRRTSCRLARIFEAVEPGSNHNQSYFENDFKTGFNKGHWDCSECINWPIEMLKTGVFRLNRIIWLLSCHTKLIYKDLSVCSPLPDGADFSRDKVSHAFLLKYISRAGTCSGANRINASLQITQNVGCGEIGSHWNINQRVILVNIMLVVGFTNFRVKCESYIRAQSILKFTQCTHSVSSDRWISPSM